MDKLFTYQGWTFERQQDDSLMITPGVSGSGGSGVFGEPNKQQQTTQQSISIPKDELYRLIGYSLTGQPNDNNVLQSVRQLAKEHVTV